MSGFIRQKAKGKRHKAMALFALCVLAADAGFAKPPVPSSAQKHDKHAPIEITSDQLEVYQAENKAVFTGHVVAIQAEDRLKADVMVVYYRKQDDAAQNDAKADKKAPAPGAPAAPQAGAIQKIDTKGNVFLSTPKETASGDYGDYDVDSQLIHLHDHVVLTHGPNVLKGDHLVYNLDTGKSVVTSDGGPTPSDNGPATGKQRVHALFIPEKKEPAKKPDAAQPAAKAAPTPAPAPKKAAKPAVKKPEPVDDDTPADAPEEAEPDDNSDTPAPAKP